MAVRKRSVALLGCAGAISGILTIHPPLPRNVLPEVGIYVGVVFGTVLAISFCAFYRPPSIIRAISVVVSSTIAYITAMFSTFWVYIFVPQPALDFSSRTGNTNPPSYVMFIGGTLGALIISTTILLLYRDESTELGKGILFCTLGGGVLGVFGYSLGLLLTDQGHQPGEMPGMTFLHIIWQAGMGGAVLIVVESDVSDSEEFIREYLELYPSSL